VAADNGTAPLWAKVSGNIARPSSCSSTDRQRLPLSIFLGDPDIYRGEAYAQQARVGQPGYSTFGTGDTRLESDPQSSDNWDQGGTGVGTTGIQSDRYDTSGQYGGAERFATDQTTGRGDASRGGATQDDDYPTSGSGGAGKPSMTSKVKGMSLLILWSCVGTG
jgi:hypothetical protein